MSGSSLDGLDLALCRFTREGERWNFKVEHCITTSFEPTFRDRLLQCMSGTALQLAEVNRDLGIMIAENVKNFLNGEAVDAIASHGHTIHHLPQQGLTTQVGSGAHIAAITGMTTVCDFRTKDVAFGGQGAPLVPIGERDLFPDHRLFVNLGGIANISAHADRILGYDIGPCNQPLNDLAAEAGHDHDAGGAIARGGSLYTPLLNALNALDFYGIPPPRSLGREWYADKLKPLITRSTLSLVDRACTAVEHVATMIAREVDRHRIPEVLITGGGAHNNFLMERIRHLATTKITLPAREIIDFKEAIIFAYLGLLRLEGRPNALRTVTGASVDNIGGAIYLPN